MTEFNDRKYFPHYIDTLMDEKVVMMYAKFGLQGYGLFWRLLECLYDSPENRISIQDPKFSIFCNRNLLNVHDTLHFIQTTDLFQFNDEYFWNLRVSNTKQEYRDYSSTMRMLGSKGGKKSAERRKTQADAQADAQPKAQANKIKENKIKEKKVNKFTPPTTTEVKSYLQELGFDLLPEAFIDYYEQQGWKLSTGAAMKDWRATLRRWQRNQKVDPVESKRREL